MIIDAYTFLGRWRDWPLKYTTAEAVVGLLDRYRIDVALIASLNFWDARRGNKEISDAVTRYPGRLLGLCMMDPRAGEGALDHLRKGVEEGWVKGLRLYPADHNYRFDGDVAWQEVVEEAVKRKMPISIPIRISANFSMPLIHPSEIYVVADTFPDARIILCGVNYGEYREVLKVMGRYDNTFLETSCLQNFNGIEKAVRDIGADRILFGTGLPLQYPACGLIKILEAHIDEAEKHLILEKNTRSLLRIGP